MLAIFIYSLKACFSFSKIWLLHPNLCLQNILKYNTTKPHISLKNQTRDVYSFASNCKTRLPPHQLWSLRFWIPTSDKMGKLIELAKDKRKKAIDFFFPPFSVVPLGWKVFRRIFTYFPA